MKSAVRAWLRPARLTWLLLAGLIAVFAGERIVPQLGAVHWVLTIGGSALLLTATLLRFLAWQMAAAEARGLARLFFLTTAACVLAVLGFLLAGKLGAALGIGGEGGPGRTDTALVVLSAILLVVALLALLAGQWALGGSLDGEVSGDLDRLRVTRLATAGATVGVAASFLMLAGYVTSARDTMIDLGYFRTASPGSAVTRITTSLGAPLRVLLFFPPANEVGDQALGYFRSLAAATRNVRIRAI